MRFLTLFALALVLISCTSKPERPSNYYTEKYRPQYHFSPEINWTNDPNGLVFFNNEYHIYYQYNPYANRWGHMSWGHATSKDLIHWEHQPIAIAEYTQADGDSVMIFSGSAVADVSNTSGFFDGNGGMVAIYTSHVHRKGEQLRQHQSIAYSSDNGKSYTRFDGNPVIDINKKDFRDPKVIWYEPQKKWVMTAVLPSEFKAQLYESKDLKSWTFMSDFGPLGDTAKIWECPDLVELPVEGTNEKKWMLIISNSHPQGPTYVGMQYFVGDFDGTKFTADNPAQYPLYIDYGKDFYAAVTYNNAPNDRKILLGWANNWAYAQDIPTSPWKSAMSLPRELSLFKTAEGLRLRQKPITEIEKLKGERIQGSMEDLQTNNSRSFVMDLYIEPIDSNFHTGLSLFKDGDEETIVGYNGGTKEVYIDRRKSGNVSFHNTFAGMEVAPARVVDGKVKLTIFVDESIIEVYVNDGEGVLTDQIFPTTTSNGIRSVIRKGTGSIVYDLWKLKSTWRE
jgi:fructan beta-fructosidase